MTSRRLVLLALVVLFALHHDLWWWDEAEPLVLGFIPIGLAWHALISFSAAIVWLLAVKFCWPKYLDDEDATDNDATDEVAADTVADAANGEVH